MLIVWLQQIGGILIVMLILLDVFLTVLYASMGSGLSSPFQTMPQKIAFGRTILQIIGF